MNDDFTTFTAAVAGYAVSGYSTGGGATDSVFYIDLTESGTPDTGAAPAVQIRPNTSLLDNATGTRLVVVGGAAVGSTDTAGPAVISAVASDETNIINGIDDDDTVTISFSENTNKPGINAGNIDAILTLSGGHSWLDGAASINSVGWNVAGDILTVTLLDNISDPTIAIGDTITLDGATITDGTTASTTAAFSAITGTFSSGATPPTLSTLTTDDVDGDGYIDRLVATFDKAVDETTIVQGYFRSIMGTVSSVVDDGVVGDAVIWVNLTDGVLATNAEPTLSIEAGGIQDTFANGNNQITDFPSVDSVPPVIMISSRKKISLFKFGTRLDWD